MKDHYNENYKTLKKEVKIKEDTRRWNDCPHSWTSRINIMKKTVLLKPICRVKAIPIIIPILFFTECIFFMYRKIDRIWEFCVK
jgi:hypothetical protein